jgi:hypothetical protein
MKLHHVILAVSLLICGTTHGVAAENNAQKGGGIGHSGLGTGPGGGNAPGGANDRAIKDQEAAERGVNPADGKTIFEINSDALRRQQEQGNVGASKN